MHRSQLAALLALFATTFTFAQQPKARIEIHADQPTKPVSRLLTGACIEDVNHEIYGGLYSQMVFGESFQEPPLLPRLKGFRVLGGRWQVRQGELHFSGELGDKIVCELPAFKDGEVGVEVYVPDRNFTNAGLIVRVDHAQKTGADNWDGYEIALNAKDQTVFLGRHQQNFRALKTARCEVPIGQWVSLTAKLNGSVLEVSVNGKSVLRYDDGRAAMLAGTVGLRQWQRSGALSKLVGQNRRPNSKTAIRNYLK